MKSVSKRESQNIADLKDIEHNLLDLECKGFSSAKFYVIMILLMISERKAIYRQLNKQWTGARVAYWNGLENRRACKRTRGSNPFPSANWRHFMREMAPFSYLSADSFSSHISFVFLLIRVANL